MNKTGKSRNKKMSTVTSEKQRETAPIVTVAELADLVGGSSTFAFKLYQQLRTGNRNLFYSPYSISLALAMTYAGARGETEEEMAETLHFLLPQNRLHPAFNALDLQLKQRGQGARGEEGEGFRLTIANALWGQEGHSFLDQFLDILAENYGAGLNLLDFTGAPEASRLAINKWISEQTEEKIQDLISPGAIDSMTRLVLSNAIYFNAAWNSPFRESNTEEGSFYPLEGGAIDVPMMHQTEQFAYGEGEGFQALELPYNGRELSMLILLPEKGRFEDFEQGMSATRLQDILQELAYKRIALTMPKFEFESSIELASTLAKMGMPLAFSDQADFSGMDGGDTLQISNVMHKAFVAVDEEGTEAAAATAVIMATKAMPIRVEPLAFTTDRPFVFLIRDIATGTILFIGRVTNPQDI
jgi:serpin B